MVFDWLALLPRYFNVQHGDLSVTRATRVHPPARTPRPGRAVQRPPAAGRVRGDRGRGRSSCVGDHDAARQHRRRPGAGRPARHAVPHRRRRRPRACSPATSRPSSTVDARRRLDLPADRPRRPADPPRRPARQGRLGQLLGVAGARRASRRRRSCATSPSATATPASRSSAITVQETDARRRPRLRRPLRADLHDRLRRLRPHLPRVRVFGLPTQFFIDPTA